MDISTKLNNQWFATSRIGLDVYFLYKKSVQFPDMHRGLKYGFFIWLPDNRDQMYLQMPMQWMNKLVSLHIQFLWYFDKFNVSSWVILCCKFWIKLWVMSSPDSEILNEYTVDVNVGFGTRFLLSKCIC